MVIAPLQSFGIGDVMFTMPIFQEMIQEGHQVLWGVEPQFLSIAKHFPNVNFVHKDVTGFDYRRKDEYIIHNTKIIPLRFTDSILNVDYKDCMASKYWYFGKDYNEWRKLVWERDWENEEKLFVHLGLKVGEQFNLINRNFRMNSLGQAEINVDNGLKNVEMAAIDGFSLLDWSGIIEQATNIHTVSTATFYMMEILDLTADEINLYRRLPDEKDFKNIEYLFTKRYILH